MYKSLLIIILLFSFSAVSKEGNEDPISNQLKRIRDQQLAMIAEEMNDPRIIEAKAELARNLYDALLKKGFTEEQALIIVSGSLTVKK